MYRFGIHYIFCLQPKLRLPEIPFALKTVNILSPLRKDLRAPSRNNLHAIFFFSLLDVTEMANRIAEGCIQMLASMDWVCRKFPLLSRNISRFSPELAFGVIQQANKEDGQLCWP